MSVIVPVVLLLVVCACVVDDLTRARRVRRRVEIEQQTSTQRLLREIRQHSDDDGRFWA